jgi:PKHD-type hydroxylase
MLICIPEILTKRQVAFFREAMANAPWEDGRVTAGAQSSIVKDNLQLPQDCAEARELGEHAL